MKIESVTGVLDTIRLKEARLREAGYIRVEKVYDKDLRPGEFVIRSAGGSESSFEAPVRHDITWAPK